MFSSSFVTLVTLTVLAVSQQALGRELIFERDNRAVFLHPRRFGQEQAPAIAKLSAACPGQFCGTLAGSAVTPLLAAQPECSQQDLADQIIDLSKQFDAATQANMLAIAIEYRQSEKNVAPDFSTNPPTLRRTVFCQTAPKNAELNCLVQAQDPATNDSSPFFDPATKASVKPGAQRNTQPFCSNSTTAATPAAASSVTNNVAIATSAAVDTASSAAASTTAAADCPTAVTVTVTSGAGQTATVSATTNAAAAATSAASSSAIGDFGICSVPKIEFGVGFDNRKETSFQPADKTSYDHGSAQAIGIITQFICDTLTNKCKADQTAKDTCKTAQAAAAAAPPKTGADADAFNNVFGIQTNFNAVQAIDDQGRPVGASGTGAATPASTAAAATTTAAVATTAATAATTAATATTAVAAATTTAAAGSTAGAGIGNFGKCSVPEIKFATGFDNRKETSFEPVDLTSYAHTSAQNGAIITQFICDTLVNTCGADQTAKDTCATARAAFDKATPAKSGAQADAFNGVFGKQTNFKAVAIVDNQGNIVAQ